MKEVIVLILVVGLVVIYAWRFALIISKKKYYERICKLICALTASSDVSNKEFLYGLLHYINSCNKDAKSIYEFRKGVTNMIRGFQKRGKLSDDVATKVLDIVYEH